jgi:hypothetical protein
MQEQYSEKLLTDLTSLTLQAEWATLCSYRCVLNVSVVRLVLCRQRSQASRCLKNADRPTNPGKRSSTNARVAWPRGFT